MIRLLFAGAAVAVLALASPASATDLPQMAAPTARAPARAVGYNWNGSYIGANIGYSWGKWDSTGTVQNGADSPSVNGVLGGIQIGYNWLNNNRWLFGLEADIQITGESKSNDWTTTPAVGAFLAPGVAVNNTWKFPWFGTARARIGYAPDNWLLYGTGGFAFGQTKSTLTTPAISLSESVTKLGWTLGGGAEYALSAKWTAKIEYLYINLGSRTFFGSSTTPVSSNLRDNVIRLGVNYKL
jgi:outer membrane immunogenic protein